MDDSTPNITPTRSKTGQFALLRLLGLFAFWIGAYWVRGFLRDDPQLDRKLVLLVPYVFAAALLLLVAQHLFRYRIPWLLEFIAMPIIAATVMLAVASVLGTA